MRQQGWLRAQAARCARAWRSAGRVARRATPPSPAPGSAPRASLLGRANANSCDGGGGDGFDRRRRAPGTAARAAAGPSGRGRTRCWLPAQRARQRSVTHCPSHRRGACTRAQHAASPPHPVLSQRRLQRRRALERRGGGRRSARRRRRRHSRCWRATSRRAAVASTTPCGNAPGRDRLYRRGLDALPNLRHARPSGCGPVNCGPPPRARPPQPAVATHPP